jgi:hypothetical protein
LLANGSLVLVGTLAHVLVADDIRAGMEVMPRRGSEDAGGLRARRCSQLCAPRTGPILADRIKRAGRRACLRLPGPLVMRRSFHMEFPMQTMQAAETTKVIYGVNELELDLAGKTVRGIWKVLEQVFNIPRDAVVTVNGTRADDDFVVHPGDEIEFQKAAGVKGQAI